MKKITRDERDFLVSKGAKHHRDVFKTYSSNPTYYCKEADWILRLLDDYKTSVIERG